MPPHDVYIEGFCGSGAVIRNKRPAVKNFALDLSKEALDLCQELAGDRTDIEYITYNACHGFGALFDQAERALIYFDPPYVMSTRVRKDVYAFEMTDADHERLLWQAKSYDCMVMISGYRSTLYDEALADWRRIDYMAQTRGGMKEESLWMNFPEPTELHDYSFLGDNFRERERIKKKKKRWQEKLANMDRLERFALMDAIGQTMKETSCQSAL